MSFEENDEDWDNSDDYDDEDEERPLIEQFPTAYDPRRRRRYRGLYDPRKRRRRGAVPPQLRSWVYRKRRRARYEPEPRRRRRRYRRRAFDPRRRYRRRRYDIPGISPFWSAILTPIATAVGGIGHGWASVKGWGSTPHRLPFVNANITTLGLAGGILSALLGYFGHGKATPSVLAHVAAGAFSEGLNVPPVEGIARIGAEGGAGGNIGEYAVPQQVM